MSAAAAPAGHMAMTRAPLARTRGQREPRRTTATII
jgi:hypothetical protein